MSLPKNYTQAYGRIPELFEKIRDGQAPDQLTHQTLKDWGFTSSNDRALLPLLKTLGFLSPDGRPTSAYHEYRDHSSSKAVLARCLREAYKDIFLIKEYPTDKDRAAIKPKISEDFSAFRTMRVAYGNAFYGERFLIEAVFFP